MNIFWAGLIGLHVLFAILWFGGNVVLGFVVGPAIGAASERAQADIGPHLSSNAQRFFRPVGVVTILLGIAIGIHLGPLTSTEALISTQYGRTFVVALALALGVWYFGETVTRKFAARIATSPPALRPIAIKRTIRATLIEQAGFLAVFVCMLLLRLHL